MRIRPLGDRILVKQNEAKEKSKGGIIIPETAQEKPVEGKVIAVGNGRILNDGNRYPVGVKKGDVVLFNRYSGTKVSSAQFDLSDDLILIREEDVLGVIEGVES